MKRSQRRGSSHLGWFLVLLVIAALATILGLNSASGAVSGWIETLFYTFLGILIVALLAHILRRG